MVSSHQPKQFKNSAVSIKEKERAGIIKEQKLPQGPQGPGLASLRAQGLYSTPYFKTILPYNVSSTSAVISRTYLVPLTNRTLYTVMNKFILLSNVIGKSLSLLDKQDT